MLSDLAIIISLAGGSLLARDGDAIAAPAGPGSVVVSHRLLHIHTLSYSVIIKNTTAKSTWWRVLATPAGICLPFNYPLMKKFVSLRGRTCDVQKI